MSVLIILAVVFAGVAAGAAFGLVETLAEVCYPDLVCGRCGEILPRTGHECTEREVT